MLPVCSRVRVQISFDYKQITILFIIEAYRVYGRTIMAEKELTYSFVFHGPGNSQATGEYLELGFGLDVDGLVVRLRQQIGYINRYSVKMPGNKIYNFSSYEVAIRFALEVCNAK